ncbi:hypothetical protein [Photobacterium sp. DNB22_13_2]
MVNLFMVGFQRLIVAFSLILHSAFAAPLVNVEAVSEYGWRAAQLTTGVGLPINQIHSWHLMITDGNGIAVDCRPQQVSGGMPAHRHGLPTQPQWQQGEKVGRYQIDGLKFQMPGLWQVILLCKDGRERNHEFTFDFML